MGQSCVAMTRPNPRDEPVTQAACPAKGLSEIIVFSVAQDRGEHIAPVGQCKRRLGSLDDTNSFGLSGFAC
jgi:hypothetical protein